MHQCVVSFCSPVQYGLLLLLTSRLSDSSINVFLLANNNIAIIVDPLPLLLVAVTIVVKNILQQMQMYMSAMEKRADTSEKYLWRIAKSMTTHNNKRKRDGTDEEDDDSSNDDK